MKLELLPYNESKQLKELGFDWLCDEFYKVETGELFDGGDFVDAENHNAYPDVVSAPTLDLACKWLRDVKNISIEVVSVRASYGEVNWLAEVYRDLVITLIVPKNRMPVSIYELAQLEGIKEAIEHLQKQPK